MDLTTRGADRRALGPLARAVRFDGATHSQMGPTDLPIRVNWSTGRMAEWSNGPMVQWPNGQMVQWSNGPMVQWSNGQMVKWYGQSRPSPRPTTAEPKEQTGPTPKGHTARGRRAASSSRSNGPAADGWSNGRRPSPGETAGQPHTVCNTARGRAGGPTAATGRPCRLALRPTANGVE